MKKKSPPGARTKTTQRPPVPIRPGPGHKQIRPSGLTPEDGVPASKSDGSSFRPANSSGEGRKTDTAPATKGTPVRGTAGGNSRPGGKSNDAALRKAARPGSLPPKK